MKDLLPFFLCGAFYCRAFRANNKMPDHWLHLFEKRPQIASALSQLAFNYQVSGISCEKSVEQHSHFDFGCGALLMAFITLPARPTYILFCPQVSALWCQSAPVCLCVWFCFRVCMTNLTVSKFFWCQILAQNVSLSVSVRVCDCVCECVVAWGPFDWMPHHNCGIRFISCWYLFDMWPTFSCGAEE